MLYDNKEKIAIIAILMIFVIIITAMAFIFENAKQKNIHELEMKKLEVEKARITSELADKYLSSRPAENGEN